LKVAEIESLILAQWGRDRDTPRVRITAGKSGETAPFSRTLREQLDVPAEPGITNPVRRICEATFAQLPT
jgi:hypothetical protein